jgi:hypothetical protein
MGLCPGRGKSVVVAMQKNNAKYFLKWNKIGKFVQFIDTKDYGNEVLYSR